MKNCLHCNQPNLTDSAFCSNCGLGFETGHSQRVNIPRKIQKKINLPVIGIISAISLVVLVFALAVIADLVKKPAPKTVEISNPNPITETFDAERDEHLRLAKIALADGYEEKQGQFGNLKEAEKHLSEIRSFDKQYDEAQKLMNEVNRRKKVIESLPTPKEIAMRDVRIQTAGTKGGFGSVLILDVTVVNPTKFNLKDFNIICSLFGASGTRLGTATQTVYDFVPAKATKSFNEINFGFINTQTSNYSCSLNDLVVE